MEDNHNRELIEKYEQLKAQLMMLETNSNSVPQNMTSDEINSDSNSVPQDIINKSDRGRPYVKTDGKRYKFYDYRDNESNQQNYFGNWSDGFVNALVLGIIVFLTETLFLLIGYLLFK